jgi:RNA polymerase sigma factor (sigma-70 family)
MHAAADHELLRRYAEHGAEEAFNELVQRHLNLVWAAARRVSGNADLARDVAQTVFTDLARKAGTLPRETVLAGWLYRAACHAAAKQARGEARRVLREHHAMAMQEPTLPDSATAQAAEELQPMLDAALAELSETDRDAVVLRFLAGRSLAEVGTALGTGEDAAQKRVSRALEKLREAFRRRGVNVSGGVMAAGLGLAGAEAAPAGLAGGLTAAALAAAGTAGGTGATLLLMKSKLTLGIVAGAAVIAALTWQQHHLTGLTEENSALRRQLAANLAKPPPSATNNPAEADSASQQQLEELLRLRGEVGQLRRQYAEISAAATRSVANKPERPVASYAAIGAATPNAGLERLILASMLGDAEGVAKFVSWRKGEDVSEEVANQMREPLTRNLTNTFAGNGKVRILNEQPEGDALVRARVEWFDQAGKANLAELRFALEGGEWKPAFNIERSPSGSFGATFFLPPGQEPGPIGQ